jgi:MFS family permease
LAVNRELATAHATALSALPAPGTRDRSRASVAALFCLSGLLSASWVSRIPEVQLLRGLSNGLLGLALLTATIGAVLTMPLAGVAVARVGSDGVAKAAALTMSATVGLLALSSPLPLFLLSLFTFGAAGGTLGVAMNAQAVLVERVQRRPIMSSFHAVFSAGGLVGAALGGILASAQVSARVHLASIALLAGVAILLAFPSLPSGKETGKGRAAPGLGSPNRRLIALGALALCAMLGEGAVADWSGVYLRHDVGASGGLAAGGFAAFSIAMAIGRALGDTLTARLGPVRLLRASGVLSASGLLFALNSHGTGCALFGFGCVGAGLAVVIPTLFSSAARAHSASPAHALALVTTLGYAGFLTGPPVIGFASELVGLRVALGLVVLTSLLIAVLAKVAAAPA